MVVILAESMDGGYWQLEGVRIVQIVRTVQKMPKEEWSVCCYWCQPRTSTVEEEAYLH